MSNLRKCSDGPQSVEVFKQLNFLNLLAVRHNGDHEQHKAVVPCQHLPADQKQSRAKIFTRLSVLYNASVHSPVLYEKPLSLKLSFPPEGKRGGEDEVVGDLSLEGKSAYVQLSLNQWAQTLEEKTQI